jgi:hypothetical protein
MASALPEGRGHGARSFHALESAQYLYWNGFTSFWCGFEELVA